jgi:hypothetical protein
MKCRQLAVVCVAGALTAGERGVQKYRGWPAYGGGDEVIRYSSLAQIHKNNVKQLEVAWTFDFGDEFPLSDPGDARGCRQCAVCHLPAVARGGARGGYRQAAVEVRSH